MSGNFHSGERAVQQTAGEVAIADRNITVLTDKVIGGARPLHRQAVHGGRGQRRPGG